MAKQRERDIIAGKLEIYDNADDDLINSLGPTEQSILKSVIGILNKLDVVDGKLANREGTLTFINQLNKEIRKIMRKSTYEDRVTAYLRKFERIDKLNQDLQKQVNDIDISKINLNPIKTQAIKDLSERLIAGTSIDANLVKPIKDIMFQSVVTGMTLDEAKKQLNLFITGDEKRLGHIRRYVSQIARDAITQYDGLVNATIANEFGLNAYRYVGSLIDDSRPQCQRWIRDKNGVLPVESLDSEIRWAFNNGRGMIPGTTVENFATFRGGYNCRHMAIPFRQVEKDNS